MTSKQIIGLISYSLISFLCGLPHSWGNISLYMFSYFFEKDFDNDFGLLNFAILLELFLFLLGFLFFQFILNRVSTELLASFSILITILALFASSYIKNQFLFIFTFNCLPGFFLGLLQSLPFEKGSIFLDDDKNIFWFKAINILLSGFNPFCLNLLTQTVVNPRNLPCIISIKTYMYYPQEVSENFPKFLLIIAVIYLIIGAIVIIGLINTRNYQKYKKNMKEILLDNLDSELNNEKLMTIVFSKEYMKIFFMAVFSTIFIAYFMVFYKEIGFSNYNNDIYLSILGSFALFFFVLGKVLWKLLSNYFNNVFLPLTMVIIIQSLIGYIFKFTAENNTLFFAITCLIFFVGGGQYVLYEKLVRKFFKDSRYRRVLAVMVNFAFVISLFSVLLVHYVFYENIGFNNLIIVMTLMGFLSFIFFL